MIFEKVADTDTDMFLKPKYGYEYPHMDKYFFGYGYPHMDADTYGCGYPQMGVEICMGIHFLRWNWEIH